MRLYSGPKTIFEDNQDRINAIVIAAQGGCEESREEVIKIYGHLIRYIAADYRRRFDPKPDIDDLCQEGAIGCLRAIDKYDPDKCPFFGIYATYWIKHYIRRFVKKNYFPFHVPEHLLNALWMKQSGRLVQLSSFIVSLCENGADHKVILRRINDLGSFEFVDIESIKIRELETRDDQLQVNFDQFEDTYYEELTTLVCRLAQKKLKTPKYVYAYCMYAGFIMDTGLTLQEIGKQIGVSRARVGQIVRKQMDPYLRKKMSTILGAATKK